MTAASKTLRTHPDGGVLFAEVGALHRYGCPATRHGRTVRGPCDCGGDEMEREYREAGGDIDVSQQELHALNYLRKWVTLRDECKRLQAERESLQCERERTAVDEFFGDEDRQQPRPCWKTYLETGKAPDNDPGDVHFDPLPRDEWCATCRKRQDVHERLRKAAASRGAYLRLLVREARGL